MVPTGLPLLNVPPGLLGLLGAAKVTCVPSATRLPNWSLTVACRLVAKAVLTVALCGVPAVAVMLKAAPGSLVRLKLAGAPTPPVDACTIYVPAVVLALKTDA